ncbi:ABC transporter substrate-binding protein [Patescibacteria group bacterium]
MKRLLIITLSLFVLGVSGCGKQQIDESAELQEVTVKLKWIHQAQFAGNYVAKDMGLYEDEGLIVDLQPFSFEEPTIDAVVNGDADFGITGADELLVARSNGMPIKAFAVIFRTNPVCAYSLKESGITKPQDLIGKTVGLERGTNVDTLYYVMMSRLGIDRSQIDEVTIGYDATELLNGDTDVSTGYIINEPNQAVEAGHEVNIILMADYGANMYADVLFATEDTIENKPELVERFLSATLDGWKYAIENEDEAVEITMNYATDSTKSHQAYMLKQSVPLIHTGDKPIGWMTETHWNEVEKVLVEQNILEKEVDVDTAYTNEFLNN